MKEIYVVIRNHENSGETYVFYGEEVGNNLVEMGHFIARYSIDKELPNWINQMLREKRKQRRKACK